jgi:hypothetical protein
LTTFNCENKTTFGTKDSQWTVLLEIVLPH